MQFHLMDYFGIIYDIVQYFIYLFAGEVSCVMGEKKTPLFPFPNQNFHNFLFIVWGKACD